MSEQSPTLALAAARGPFDLRVKLASSLAQSAIGIVLLGWVAVPLAQIMTGDAGRALFISPPLHLFGTALAIVSLATAGGESGVRRWAALAIALGIGWYLLVPAMYALAAIAPARAL